MSPTDKFSAADVQRIVGLSRKQLEHWTRLRLISPQQEQGAHYYDFRDLIGLRTIKQLFESGVSANRLQRTLSALNEKLTQVKTPLSQLRILSDGKDIVVEYKKLLTLPGQEEYTLHPGDVIYVPVSGFNKVTGIMQKISPAATMISIAALVGAG